MNALIGYTGFVGSNLKNQYNFTHLYNSSNINQINNQTFDLVVCCGTYANKWLINQHPEEDLNNINTLIDHLMTIKCNRFVLISTIDVYDNISNGSDELFETSNELSESDKLSKNTNTNTNINNHYGKNRSYLEQFIESNFENYHIVRLPGLFGYGLKKNVIYDMLNDNLLQNINLNTYFQWYYLGDLMNDINYCIMHNINCINLFTEPIITKDIYDIFHSQKDMPKLKFTEEPTIKYNLKTMFSFDGYWRNKEYILDKMTLYISTMLHNNLAISTLSWKNVNIEDVKMTIQKYNMKNLEVAPYSFYGNDNKYFVKEQPNTFGIYSLQSIIYPYTYNLFNPDEIDDLYNLMINIIDFASKKNIKVLVFGSPKNRKIYDLPYDDAFNIAVEFFKKVGDYAFLHDVIVCIEPNARTYDCDFVVNSKQGRELVFAVDSPGFKLHLDIACMYLENENVIESIKYNLDILKHIHISYPYLKKLNSNPDVQINYKEIINFLKINYKYTYTIEMLQLTTHDIDDVIYNLLI